jgi:Skp family chaperone for outer membrane proteins
MKPKTKLSMTLALMVVMALPVLAASPTSQADKVAAKMLDFDKYLSAASAQITTTLASLNAMSTANGSDLVSKYKDFGKQVQKLDDMAKKAKAQSEKSSAQRDEYLKQWQASQDQIQNEQLKASSEARRAELMPKIEAIKTSLGSARDTFGPFMQDLKDINTYLGNNLTPQGVAGAADLITKCNTDGTKVTADIAKGQESIKDLANSIQPGGTPAKK